MSRKLGGRWTVFLIMNEMIDEGLGLTAQISVRVRRRSAAAGRSSSLDQSTLDTCITSPLQVTTQDERSSAAVTTTTTTTTTGKKECPPATFRGREPRRRRSTLLVLGLSRRQDDRG